MGDNMELFNEEIEEIKEFMEMDMDTFNDLLDCTRAVIGKFGERISPLATVDVIEGAVGYFIFAPEDEPITVEEAVDRAVSNLHLDEMGAMFDEIAVENGTDYSDTKSMQ